jgi:hypothetical protein
MELALMFLQKKPKRKETDMKEIVLCENDKYYAYIVISRKLMLVGCYRTLAAARLACREASIKLGVA